MSKNCAPSGYINSLLWLRRTVMVIVNIAVAINRSLNNHMSFLNLCPLSRNTKERLTGPGRT
jgi:hypothetical protein